MDEDPDPLPPGSPRGPTPQDLLAVVLLAAVLIQVFQTFVLSHGLVDQARQDRQRRIAAFEETVGSP